MRADLAHITAVILAGGLGKRLASLLPETQKVAAKIGDHPFIYLLLDQLMAAGIQHVIVCTGYRAADIRDALGDTYKMLKITYSHEDFPLGTGGAIRLALEKIHSDPFLVMNGDSYIRTDFDSFLSWFFEKGIQAGLVMTHVAETGRYGRLVLGRHDCVRQFLEKTENTASGWINAGIYLFKKSVFEQLPKEQFISLENNIFPRLCGQNLYGYRGLGNFIDIGTPEAYKSAWEMLFPKAGKTAVKAVSAEIPPQDEYTL